MPKWRMHMRCFEFKSGAAHPNEDAVLGGGGHHGLQLGDVQCHWFLEQHWLLGSNLLTFVT